MPGTIADLEAAIAAHKVKIDNLKATCDTLSPKAIETMQELTNVISRLLADLAVAQAASAVDTQPQIDEIKALDAEVDASSQSVSDSVTKLQSAIDQAKVQN